MAVQLGYTVGVHWAALGWRPPFTDAAKVVGGLLGFVAGLVPQALGLFADHLAPTRLSRGELVYRGFLAFYGLIFPAYAWLCMLPTPDGVRPHPPQAPRLRRRRDRRRPRCSGSASSSGK